MILCIGEAVMDMILSPVSGIGDVFRPLPGGCAYNTSIAIGRLGSDVSFLGRLSESFFADMQVKRLTENNVKNLSVRAPENTVLAFIKTEEGREPQYAFYDEGTADRLLSSDELPLELLPCINCIVYGSISMAMEPIASTIENFIFRDENRKKVITFDPNIRPFMIKNKSAYLKRFEKWAGASTIVKISLEDFEYIHPNSGTEEALEKLTAMGTRLAILTLGHEGAAALLRRDDGNIVKASAPGVHIPILADTVGAGDTFHGAFLVWLEQRDKLSPNAIANLSENDLYDALSFANKAASFVCTRHGAEPPFPGEI